MLELYADVTNISNPISIDVATSHNAAAAVATIRAETQGLNIGDEIEIDMGYTSSHGKVFEGYVKQVERNIPDGVWTITAKDKMIRALDFFVVSKDPDKPFKRKNIKAENLVRDVLALAGLTNYGKTATAFVFATGKEPAEVNLVSAYDYCNGIADLLTWHLYCDMNGKAWFVNRKPYPMTGASGQWGDTTDETVDGYELTELTQAEILNVSYKRDERDLRNRVVVYGAEGIFAEAKASSPHLPSGFYKTAVLSSSIIAKQSYAQTTATYNLNRWNRLNYEVGLSVIGDYRLNAREIVQITEPILGLTGNWYVYSSEHTWDENGYINKMVVKR